MSRRSMFVPNIRIKPCGAHVLNSEAIAVMLFLTGWQPKNRSFTKVEQTLAKIEEIEDPRATKAMLRAVREPRGM
jgi:hypothetical protein